jgi:hypothetical protein
VNTGVKLASFLAGLGVVFAVAAGAGTLAGPDDRAEEHEGGDTMTTTTRTGGDSAAATAVKGLQLAKDGYTLVPGTTELPATGGIYTFRITGPDGRVVTEYRDSHGKELHLIAVRRDLAGYAHLHPVRAADGTWSVQLTPSAGPGSYRIFADFTPARRDAGLTLGADLAVRGNFVPRELPAASRTAAADGYTVGLDGELKPGAVSTVTLTVRRAGEPVRDLQPYLGAYGHLVAIRAGDLAYLHVHPEAGGPGPEIRFKAEVPSAGSYRLFLDFQHAGKVRTAEFTAAAEGHGAGPAPASPAGGHGHGD